MSQLELYIQGGLGNQLIQQAYAHGLCKRTGYQLKANSLLLSKTISRLRRVSTRELGFKDLEIIKTSLGSPQTLSGTLLRLLSTRILDSTGDETALDILNSERRRRVVAIIGYFQRAESFGESTYEFWETLANQLKDQYGLRCREKGEIAIHSRQGDYRSKRFRKVYAAITLEQQIRDALDWRDQLGSNAPLHLFSDDPIVALNSCPSHISREVLVQRSGRTAEEDFTELACYKHHVISNSTFGMAAGKVAACLWNLKHSTLMPSRWYNNERLNQNFLEEFSDLDFVTSSPPR